MGAQLAQGAPPCSPELDRATRTPLSHSSMASPSPAVLLKLLVLEEEREMLARPFSFNFMKGLWGTGSKAGPGHTPIPPGPRAGQGQQRWSLPTSCTSCSCLLACALESSLGKRCWLSGCLEQTAYSRAPRGQSQPFPNPVSYFSLLGQISGELGLDEVSYFIS